MVILLQHAGGAAVMAAHHDRAFLVLLKGVAGHRLEAAHGELRAGF